MSTPPDSVSTALARESSQLSADRTLMAWVRTALALIGIGFSIDRLFLALRKLSPETAEERGIHPTRIVGAAFILLGVVSLVVASLQHWYIRRRIARRDFVSAPPWPVTEAVAFVTLLIGLYSLISLARD
jgi:putative membrane protein